LVRYFCTTTTKEEQKQKKQRQLLATLSSFSVLFLLCVPRSSPMHLFFCTTPLITGSICLLLFFEKKFLYLCLCLFSMSSSFERGYRIGFFFFGSVCTSRGVVLFFISPPCLPPLTF